MATVRSKQNPYRWSNNTWHSRPENTGAGAPKPVTAPPKPRPVPPSPGPAQNPPGFAERVPGQFAPPDPVYEQRVQGLRQQRTNTMADLAAGRQQGLAGYGYNENADTGALAFDPNNPFSKAALLKKTYDQSRRRTGNVMASGGSLYAGAYQSAQDVQNRGQLQDEDALQKSLADFLARNTQAEAGARTRYETNVEDEEAARIARVDTNPLYDPTNMRTTPKPPKPAKPPKPTTPKKPAAKAPKGKPYQWSNKSWHTRPQRKRR